MRGVQVLLEREDGGFRVVWGVLTFDDKERIVSLRCGGVTYPAPFSFTTPQFSRPQPGQWVDAARLTYDPRWPLQMEHESLGLVQVVEVARGHPFSAPG
jgi:hypothetical protein